jgi:membrane associated rhomboid family serine protease
MSIYDREYIRVGPRSRSGLGTLRFISFNSWLIILNVLVFAADVATSTRPVPVVLEQTVAPGVDQRSLLQEGFLRDGVGNPIPERVPMLVRDGQGNVFPDPQGRTMPNPQLRVNAVANRLLGVPNSPQAVGSQKVVMMSPVKAYGHLSTHYGVYGVQVWRYLTFQFLHGDFWHLFFNMLGLYIFGGMVEQYLGSRRYAAFYLTCGIFGAIAYIVLNLIGYGTQLPIPGLLTTSLYTPLVGASAGVFGVIMACAFIAPNAIVQLLFPPIPMKLKWFAYGYVAFALLNLLRGGQNAGGDAAHVGGAIAGYFFIRNAHHLRGFFDIFGSSERAGPSTSADSAEVDRILGKVARDGLVSLTDAERRTLRRASEQRR